MFSNWYNFIYTDSVDYADEGFTDKILENFDAKNPNNDLGWDCFVETSHYCDHKPKVPDKLINIINLKLEKFSETLNNSFFTDLKINDIWYNVYTRNMYQERHAHCPALFAGVYMFKFNERVHSPTVFYNNFFSPDYYESDFNDIDLFRFVPALKQGSLLIFPGNMVHEVLKQETDEIRISIAFNIYSGQIVKAPLHLWSYS